jgi:hypothetical protein
MTTSIFVRTYYRDLPWLKFCLRSIEKFASGFAEVVVVGPDDGNAGQIEQECSAHGARFVTGVKEAAGRGNLASQFYALSADLISDADLILYVDSDCVFFAPVTPDMFHPPEADMCPYLCVRPWDKSRADERQSWEKTTDAVMGMKTLFSCMVRHPAVHHRWLLPRFRAFIEETHRKKFDDYVFSRKADFPQGLSEFNAMGSFARAFYFDDYTWVDVTVSAEPPSHTRQGWSHGGIREEDISLFRSLGLVDESERKDGL